MVSSDHFIGGRFNETLFREDPGSGTGKTSYQELAKEAFETGKSINQLCLEALLARKALEDYDPWKAIEAIWQDNWKVDPAGLEKEALRL